MKKIGFFSFVQQAKTDRLFWQLIAARKDARNAYNELLRHSL